MAILGKIFGISGLLVASSFLLAWIGPGRNSEVGTGASNYFPSMHGMSMAGEESGLPAVFSGGKNLVVLVFKPYQRAAASSWGEYYERMKVNYPDTKFFVILLLEQRSRFRRSSFNNIVRNHVGKAEDRSRTFVIYTDRAEFLEVLNITDMRSVYPMLIDGRGEIIWRGIGSAGGNEGLEKRLGASS